MDAWEALFQAVRNLVRSSADFEEGRRQAIAFAQAMPERFDAPEFWNRAANQWQPSTANAMIGWAKSGLERLDPGAGWETLLLDLGDCPEVFRLYSPGHQALMSERRLRDLLFTTTVIGVAELEGCLTPDLENPFALLFGDAGKNLTDHNVRELNDDLLGWNRAGADYHGYNGYFLWLAFGTLALIQPLRQREFCRLTLGGRDKIYLLAGFEEIFTYLVTLTPEGARFEDDPSELSGLKSGMAPGESEAHAQITMTFDGG